MKFTFEALPAHKGDALLVRFGTQAKPLLAIIDGGPSNTYRPALKPRLLEIKSDHGIDVADPLPIDLLMVSHIDDDHIKGVLELTRDMTEADDNHQPRPYDIRTVWHNSFDDVLGTTPEELQASVMAQFGAASSSEMAVELYPALTQEAAMVLASIPQGRRLRDDIKKLDLDLNEPFKGLVILNPKAEKKIRLGPKGPGGLDVRVIGPLKPQLDALQKEHDAYLRKQKKKKSDGEAALAAFTDSSAPNLSSIVTEIRGDSGSMLLTGDARGDFVLEGLKACGMLTTKKKTYAVDLLKVPHHGSDRNMTREFFEQVHATHYVFSGDGGHGNPERETLQMLFDARGHVDALSSSPFTIWLTYSVDDVDVKREEDWEKERKKGRKTRRWNAEKDSLQAFFDDVATRSGLDFTLEDSRAVRIDL